MSKFHDDPYLWATIKNVATGASNEVLEQIYKELEGTTWSIRKIEKLAERLGGNG